MKRLYALALLCCPLFATNYYVDAVAGLDTNTGLSGAPWQTLTPVNAHGTVVGGETGGIFIANAETGNTGQFTSVSTSGSATFTATTGAAIHGTYGFNPTGDGTNYTYATKSITAASTIYVRFYLYVPVAFSETANLNYTYLLSLNNGATVLSHLYLQQYSSSSYQLHAQLNSGSYSNFGSSTLNTGAVHYVELEYVQSATVGGIQFWIDGSSIGSIFTQNTSSSVNSIQFGFISNNPPSSGASIAFDDLKASTTGPIGAYAGSTTPGTCTGDTIYLNRGNTWSQNLIPGCSGASGSQMMAFDAYGSGAAPIISGTGQYGASLAGVSYVSVKNIEFTGASSAGIALTSTANNNVIQYNYIHDAGYVSGYLAGIVINGGSSNTISYNIVSNQTAGDNQTYGILISGYGSVASSSNTVSFNTVAASLGSGIRIDAASGTAPASNSILNNDVSRNAIGAYDAGIYMIGAGVGTIVSSNSVYNNGTSAQGGAGIWVGSGSSATTVSFNQISGNTNGCITVDGSNSHAIYNNTCFQNNQQSTWDRGEMALSNGASSVNVRNNLFWATPAKHVLQGYSGAITGHTLDYNLFFGGQASPFGWNGTDYSYSGWTATAGQSAHGVLANPLLVDPATSNFSLGDASAARNVGVVITTLPYSYLAPDLGAIPYYAKQANTAAFF